MNKPRFLGVTFALVVLLALASASASSAAPSAQATATMSATMSGAAMPSLTKLFKIAVVAPSAKNDLASTKASPMR